MFAQPCQPEIRKKKKKKHFLLQCTIRVPPKGWKSLEPPPSPDSADSSPPIPTPPELQSVDPIVPPPGAGHLTETLSGGFGAQLEVKDHMPEEAKLRFLTQLQTAAGLPNDFGLYFYPLLLTEHFPTKSCDSAGKLKSRVWIFHFHRCMVPLGSSLSVLSSCRTAPHRRKPRASVSIFNFKAWTVSECPVETRETLGERQSYVLVCCKKLLVTSSFLICQSIKKS